jgi:4-amino-4-deoxy-L-arabinose transferase-like glycosyltransferase
MIRRPMISGKAAQLLAMAAIIALVALLTLNRLGASDVCGGSEAVMGVFVQQMVEHDQLLFPLDNCQVPMYKPPLFHWTSSALDYLSGENVVTAFNLRLPSALYATAGAILTMFFALNLLGVRGAILSGAILAGSYQYISQGRIGLVDMTLTFFEALSLYAFLWWFLIDTDAPAALRHKRRLHYLFATSMGLGVLAKGPVGALLPAAAMTVFLALHERWQTLRDLFKAGPLVLGAAIAFSWYLACLIGQRFSFLSLQLGSENFGRFFGILGAMPAWYYLKPLLLNSIPSSLLVPVAVATAFAIPIPLRDESHDSQGYSRALCARFFATFWVVTVVFFELSAFKRRAYLLPLWPASAVLLSWWVLDCAVPRVGTAAYQGIMAICLLLAIGNLFFLPSYEMRGCGNPLSLVEMLKWPFESLVGRPYAEGFQAKSFREAAARVNSVVSRNQPLYVFQIEDAIEPLVIYLGRCAPQLHGSLSTAPPGYILTTVPTWTRLKESVPQLRSVFSAPYGADGLVLLHSGSGAAPQTQ